MDSHKQVSNANNNNATSNTQPTGPQKNPPKDFESYAVCRLHK